MVNQRLLKTLAECEYPAEFLVARLLGKKGPLPRNWELLIASSDIVQYLLNTPFYPYLKKYGPSGMWRFLRNEYLWVYSRMNPDLRKTFSPYFVFHEQNILVVCLRYLESKEEIESVHQELQHSLLHNDIQKILTGGFDFITILQALESHLAKTHDSFGGLKKQYEDKGIAGLEFFIRNCFFTQILSERPRALLKSFFQYLIDFHNCMTLAKTLRWQIEAEPTLIPGGRIPDDRFRRAYFRKDMVPVLTFLHLDRIAETSADMQKLETAFLFFITKKLKKWSYQRTPIGDILFYLWEQYRYTRNISMVLSTPLLDDGIVREKIVA